MAHIITFQNVDLFSWIILYIMLWEKWSYFSTSVDSNPNENIEQIEQQSREKHIFEAIM
jgi:phosphopentomutase